ncbi:mismatch-specific DNA-glycosylase [Naumannella sp. ID2617S]|nr:mismatch-specific DNA-glycosylase [Naumannella sp. ID2617S]
MTRRSPLGGRRPRREELASFVDAGIDDVIGERVRLLVVGINPGLWTAAVNAPFAHPANRFWPSLAAAGLMSHKVDAASGLSEADEAEFTGRGLGLTNLVDRATVRADELSNDELIAGRERLETLVGKLKPAVVAVVGITAYRVAFGEKRAVLGLQEKRLGGAELWVLPQPSGLNAHATLPVLTDWWRRVGAAAGILPGTP